MLFLSLLQRVVVAPFQLAKFFMRLAVIVLAGFALAGCSLGSVPSFGDLGGSVFGSSEKKKEATTSEKLLSEDRLLAEAKQEVTAHSQDAKQASLCTKFKIWDAERFLTVYDVGRYGDGLAVRYRGELTKAARECVLQDFWEGFIMTDELYWLTLTAAVTLFMGFPYVLERIFRIGIIDTANYTSEGTAGFDQSVEAPAKWAKRAFRAHRNAIESLAIIAILVLTAHVADVKDPNILLGVQIYFFARLTHYIVYVLGVPLIRPLVFFSAWSGMALIAYALLCAGA